ncbi:Calbindin-32 [Gryllus bimaculatus]|nr:Calbindin-32 [Gryllus bimaculatus]
MSGGPASTKPAGGASARPHHAAATNFLRQFRDPHSRELRRLSAHQFMDVMVISKARNWTASCENSCLLRTKQMSVLSGCWRALAWAARGRGGAGRSAAPKGVSAHTCTHAQAVSDAMLQELKRCFLEAYDDNQDGKIDIRELAQLLPMEENFLLLFRFDNPLESSVEFMKIWREYDSDGSGYIEADELKNFLRDLLKEAKKINDVSEDKLIEYTDTMMIETFKKY